MPLPFDQRSHQVRLEWGPTGAASIVPAATYAVVVDVLSFTTTLTVAADLGIDVLPYPWKDGSAAAYAHRHGATLAVGRSEAARGGRGAVSLSPVSLRAAAGTSETGLPGLVLPGLVLPGLVLPRLVLPSPNGSSISFVLRDSGATVIGASLRNAAAVAGWLAARLTADPGAAVAVVAAGERWPDGSLRPCLEDLLGAGAVVAGLEDAGVVAVSPEAGAAAASYRHAAPRLPEAVRGCSSGRELASRGFAGDVEVAIEVNSSSFVPVLQGMFFTRAAVSDDWRDG